MGEFGLVCLIGTTCVYPKPFEVILCNLFSIEPDILITRLILASAICQVFKGSLLGICSLRVRKYSIGRNGLVAKLGKTEIASVATSQKTHCFAWIWTGASGKN